MKKNQLLKQSAAILMAGMMVAGLGACGKSQPENTDTPRESQTEEPAGSETPGNSGAQDASGAEVVIKLAHNLTIGGTEDEAVNRFAELVAEKTNGAVVVQVYGGGQLGDETDLLEGLQLGTVDACLSTSAYLSNLVPQYALLDAPFLFDDLTDVRAKLEGEAGDKLKEELLSQQNMRVLGFWNSGFRVMLTKSAAITSLEDIQKRKMRAPEVPVYIDMFEALGAAPTAIPFSEVYTSINSGVVDGVEVCAEEMYTMKFHEVGKYIAKTNHIFSTMIPIISEKVFSSLTVEQQTAVLEAAAEATEYEWEIFEEADVHALKEMEASGVEVSDLTDREDWVEACIGLQDQYAQEADAQDLLDLLRK